MPPGRAWGAIRHVSVGRPRCWRTRTLCTSPACSIRSRWIRTPFGCSLSASASFSPYRPAAELIPGARTSAHAWAERARHRGRSRTPGPRSDFYTLRRVIPGMGRWSTRYHPRFENKSMTPSSSKPTPRPGQPVRGSRTGRPVMALLDLLGRRWWVTRFRQLRDGDPLTFRESSSPGRATSPRACSTTGCANCARPPSSTLSRARATGSRPKVRTSWRR